ncbi:MAG: arginine--tRNA ligase [Candidatus Bathyarchaeota archaeon]
MNPLAQLRDECEKLLRGALDVAYPGAELPEAKFSEPPSPEMGAISTPVCFQLARELRQPPKRIAETIVGRIKPGKASLVSKAEALNGYINFHADTGNYSKLVLETAVKLDEEYGFLKASNPERVMVEHTSANPIHPITIGTARNSILGACLANLVRKRGHPTLVHFLVNDMGRQVALATYGWMLLGKPEPDIRGELYVGAIYAGVNINVELLRVEKELREAEKQGNVYGGAELQEELEKFQTAADDLAASYPEIFNSLKEKIRKVPDPANEIVRINTAYENNEPETVETVRRLVKICLDGFEESLGEMGITYDAFDYESDLVWDKKADEVLLALKNTPYVEVDQGALVLDCDGIARDYDLKRKWGLNEAHEIPRLVLVRSDGTTLYTLRDIAYSIYKFGQADRVINVIGQEQALAQLQLRIALVAIGRAQMGDNQLHYGYEFVKLPMGKMSGRLGRYVTLLEVVEKSTELAYEEVTRRTPELTEEQRRGIARMVGYGAVKYTLLSVDANKTVVFDWDKALNFETNSAPFIQYSHARTCNILKKAEERPKPDYEQLTDLKERELVNMLARFPEVFEGAAAELQPGDITTYANSLADKFNSFYATQRVINAETPGLVGARVDIVDATRATLRNALELLGIEAPERM